MTPDPFDTLRRSEPPPSGFAERTLAAVVRDRRRRVRVRVAGRVTTATALFVGVGLAGYSVRPVQTPQVAATVAPIPEPLPEPKPTLVNPLTAAQDALVNATQRAGDAALSPAKSLFTLRTEPALPAVVPPVAVPTPTVSVAMLEPLTETTRRAAGLFLHDLRQLSGRPAAPATAPERP
jgi:hypothetical protein